MSASKMFYTLLLLYLLLLQHTVTTDFSVKIFWENMLNIVVTLDPAPNFTNPQVYFTLECMSSPYNKSWLPCKTVSSNATYYEFETDRQLFFHFNMTYTKGQKIWHEIKFYRKYDIPIHLPPLSDIGFSSLPATDPYKTSVKLELVKSINLSMKVLKLRYRVRYWSEWETAADFKNKSFSTKEIVLKDLTPFTNYTFIADFRIQKNRMAWGQTFTKYFRTETGTPYMPNTTYGRYHEWSCPSTAKRRCITVYWQSLPLKFRNDILIGYCVQYIGESLSTNKTDQCLNSNNQTVDALHKDFEDLPRNQTLTFSIVAVTKSRRMSQPSFIQVKNTAPMRPKAVYVIKISDTMYNVSWLTEQRQEVVNVTVFWCQDENPSSKIQCADQIKLKTVANQSYLLVNYSLKQPPDFAVYFSTGERRSSLTKAECIFPHRKRPKKPPKPIIVWSDTKIYLTWPTLLCSHWNGIPVAYVLRYAEGKRCEIGKKKEFPVKGIKVLESTVVVNDLRRNTDYSVCIQVKTQEGISLMSEAITGKTEDNENSSMVILYVFISILVALFFIIMVIKSIRSHHKYITEIEIDTMDTASSNSDDRQCNYERIQNYENPQVDANKLKFSISNESGYYSSNNSSDKQSRNQEIRISTENLSEYIQVDHLTIECVDTLRNIKIDNIKAPFLSNKIEKNENVSNRTGYVDAPGDCFGEFTPESVPTCMNGSLKENVSNGTGYVDAPGDCFREVMPSESVLTCVNNNCNENVSNGTGYVDAPGDCFRELTPESVPTCIKSNFNENVSNGTGYIDVPGDYGDRLMSNSVPTCKTVNSEGIIPDYILSEPVIKNNISQNSEHINNESTNSHENKSLKGQTLQTEGKENNQKKTTKFKGKADKKNVKGNFSVNYIAHDDTVKVIDSSSSDEIKDKNIQEDRQGISQNSVGSCDLTNGNVHKSSDYSQKETIDGNLKTPLQRQDNKTDILHVKDTVQEPDTSGYIDTSDYVKTESCLGYVLNSNNNNSNDDDDNEISHLEHYK